MQIDAMGWPRLLGRAAAVAFVGLAVVFLIRPNAAQTAQAGAVPNSVQIRALDPAHAGYRPVTVSRVFAQGEIPNCAKAVVEGVPADTQCDVKTRWPDGSLQHALVSFWVNVPAATTLTVAFVDQKVTDDPGLSKAEMLSDNYSFGGDIEITHAGDTQIASAREMLQDWNEIPNATGVRYWMRGAICTQLILEDATAERAYDLGWDANQSLHPMFVVTFYKGWSGVKVEMILENMWVNFYRDQQYSLALRVGNPSPAAPVYTKATFTHWARTRWRKTFWGGAEPPAINIDYNLPYMVYSRLLPNYDLTKVVSAGAVHGEMWGDGNTEGKCTPQKPCAGSFLGSDRGDINGSAQWEKFFPATGGNGQGYVGFVPRWYTRYLYTFDADLYQAMLGDGGVSGHVPIHYRESRPSQITILAVTNTSPIRITTAGPHQVAKGAKIRIEGVEGNTAANGTWTVTVVDQTNLTLNNSKGNGNYTAGGVLVTSYFDAARTVPAEGRVLSLSAGGRPTWRMGGANRSEDATMEPSTGTGHGWTPDTAHQPSFTFVPYFITGDWYFLEEMYYWANYGVSTVNALDTSSPGAYWRHADWGYLNELGLELRGAAWCLRNMGHAAFAAPDGSPEKEYFTAMTVNNAAVREGLFDIHDGEFCKPNASGACTDPRWIWGRQAVGSSHANPLYTVAQTGGSSRNASTNQDYPANPQIDPNQISLIGSPWMENFMRLVIGQLTEMGFPFGAVSRVESINLINQVLHPDYNPYLAGEYRIPTLDTNGKFLTNWADVRRAYRQDLRDRTDFCCFPNNAEGAYSQIAMAAASYAVGVQDGPRDGLAAWEWMVKNVPYQSILNDNPKWAIVPRPAVVKTATAAIRSGQE